MKLKRHAPDHLTAATPHDLVIVQGKEAFTLEPGHRLRAASCLICHELIGGEAVTAVGVAALDTNPCDCGGIPVDAFLIHVRHLPLHPTALQTALSRGLQCGPHQF